MKCPTCGAGMSQSGGQCPSCKAPRFIPTITATLTPAPGDDTDDLIPASPTVLAGLDPELTLLPGAAVSEPVNGSGDSTGLPAAAGGISDDSWASGEALTVVHDPRAGAASGV